jgi:hypothetical protein
MERYTFPKGATSFRLTHRYLDDDPSGTGVDKPVVALTLSDNHGGQAVRSGQVFVTNAAPVVNLAGLPGSLGQVDEGEAVLLDATAYFSDAGSRDTHSFVWEVDAHDGRTIAPVSGRTFTFLPLNQGSYTIRLKVTDDDGGWAQSEATVTVLNVAPAGLTVSAPVEIAEGTVLVVSGSFADPGRDAWSGGIDFSGGGSFAPMAVDPASKSFSASQYFGTPGTYTIKVRIDDGSGAVAESTLVVRVINVAPAVRAVADATLYDQQTLVKTLEIVDPLPGSWSISVDWGDGTSSGYESGASRFVEIRHAYERAGAYDVAVWVIDESGGEGRGGFKTQVRLFGDADRDGDVDFADLAGLRGTAMKRVGDPGFDGRYDREGDGDVDSEDIFWFRSNYGLVAAVPQFGDSDGDGDVDFTDLFRFRATYLKSSGEAGFDTRFDWDSDGDVDAADLFQFRARYEAGLMAAAPAAAAALAEAVAADGGSSEVEATVTPVVKAAAAVPDAQTLSSPATAEVRPAAASLSGTPQAVAPMLPVAKDSVSVARTAAQVAEVSTAGLPWSIGSRGPAVFQLGWAFRPLATSSWLPSWPSGPERGGGWMSGDAPGAQHALLKLRNRW